MAEGKEKTQRRVYVLPTELVERIVAYQQELGLTSEVEAARRLLDDALKQRDTFRTITTKLIEKLTETRSLREAAREVITNHPLVTSISFRDDLMEFTLKNGYRVEVFPSKKATVYDENNNLHNFEWDIYGRPDWASMDHPPAKTKSGSKSGKRYDELDDDIPF